MTRSPPRRSPVSTGFGTTVPSAATVNTTCCDWSSRTAVSGTIRAGAGGATARRSRAKAPGVRNRSGLATRARAWIVPLEPIERVVDEFQRPLPCEAGLVAEADVDLVGERARRAGPLAREGQEVGSAHVEVEMDRVERDQGGQQRGRAAGKATAGDRGADRDLVRADAAAEGGDDAAVLDVELGVADLGPGVVDRGLSGAYIGGALVNAFGRPGNPCA